MDKYSKPTLPSPRCVFEDLSTLNSTNLKEPLQFTGGDERLRDSYNIYLNFKQLKNDITEQQSLNNNLEELNKQLMDNIENMRKQQNANE